MSRTARLLNTGMGQSFGTAISKPASRRRQARRVSRSGTRSRQWHVLLRGLRARWRRIANIPLAQLVAVVTLGQIDVDMAFVVAVGARPEHGHKARASALAQTIAKFVRDLRVGRAEHRAIRELE